MSKTGLQWAQAFAGRVVLTAGRPPPTGGSRVALAYSRKPDAKDLQTALRFLERQRGIIAAREGAARLFPAGPEPMTGCSGSVGGSVSDADEVERVCVSELMSPSGTE